MFLGLICFSLAGCTFVEGTLGCCFPATTMTTTTSLALLPANGDERVFQASFALISRCVRCLFAESAVRLAGWWMVKHKYTRPFVCRYGWSPPYASTHLSSTIHSYIQPYTAVRRHTQPYTTIYSHIQTCTVTC